MQLIQKYWTLFFAFFLTHSIYAQTVEYDIEVAENLRIETYYEDGSLLVSTINSTNQFSLDSITPSGIYINKNTLSLASFTDPISDYLYTKEFGLYIATIVDTVDTAYPYQSFRCNDLFRLNLNGDKLWTIRLDFMVDDQLSFVKFLKSNSALFLTKATFVDGSCKNIYELYKMDYLSGQLILTDGIGVCHYKSNPKEDSDLVFSFSSGCSCNDNEEERGDAIRMYDDSMNLIYATTLENTSFKSNGIKYLASEVEILDENNFLAESSTENDTDNGLVYINKVDSTLNWYSLTDSISSLSYQISKVKLEIFDGGIISAHATNQNVSGGLNVGDLSLLLLNNEVSIMDTILNIQSNIGFYSVESVELIHNSIVINYTDTTNKLMRISLGAPLGTKEDELFSYESSFEVYPNPTAGNVTVKSNVGGVIELYDITGKLQFRKQVSEGENQFYLDTFEKGVYVLTFQTQSGERGSKKLILTQ